MERNRQPEIMDQEDLPEELHVHALSGLARLNKVSFIAPILFRHLKKIASQHTSGKLRVLDVASGSADLPIAWSQMGNRCGIDIEVTTVEISHFAIEKQFQRAALAGVKISAIQQDCIREPLPTGFDVITNSLFLHHLDPHDTIHLLKSMHSAARVASMVCDLERSKLNRELISAASRVLTRSKVVHHDARLSVEGAYTLSEAKTLAEEAVGGTIQARRIFPGRFYFKLWAPDFAPTNNQHRRSP
ncbi:hypothetical protein K227x_18340 [Rubripirellula lacrimiformis]|uniref:Methyltransferase domain-containing protein n=1 Tax=Rubripirellula lacrimiformis TaxID=1930273 RepID=A0A517N8J9_9BACT|nr:methyltransferase domain-containing protein [Rubripirellula lacrimiformis]QDT03450.1 hypothetical protein K227x_18340 [Rubripirellula lacrimiformis]